MHTDTLVERLRRAGCVFAEEEAAVLLGAAGDPATLDAMLARRVAGEPLEHVVGWVAFRGLRIAVDPGVFVPRRRTEFLAAIALRHVTPGAVVVDLCCGSGAVGAALGAVELYAVDIDPAAVDCARRNLPGATVLRGDLYAPLPPALRGRVGLIVANTPYVPSGAVATMPPEARDHEPRTALDGGADGLDIQRRVTAAARDWLTPAGHLLIETSDAQAPALTEAFTAGGLTAEVIADDDTGATVVVGAPG
ncbi:putative protein N(5)-glutamine methyltransferase [Amycolatopsis suaedae]|nr:putative protein N(5)-glutamine methyltransferase [Amycolatopsis suaedae]